MDPRQDYIQTRHFRSAPHNLSFPVELSSTKLQHPVLGRLGLFSLTCPYSIYLSGKIYSYVLKICEADAAPISWDSGEKISLIWIQRKEHQLHFITWPCRGQTCISSLVKHGLVKLGSHSVSLVTYVQ